MEGKFIKRSGRIRVGYKTKELVKKIRPGEVAVINHQNLDEVGARSLIKARVKAVLNLQDSITGDFPNRGPGLLLEKKIPIVDKINKEFIEKVDNGSKIKIIDGFIYNYNSEILGEGRLLTSKVHAKLINESYKNMSIAYENFVDNTLKYAIMEKDKFSKSINLSGVTTRFKDRECFIVCRGSSHREDLRVVKDYIKINKPVLIGVDGGGDTLLEDGLCPDIILGDMDSVSKKALNKAKELLLHAYPGGFAPGEERLIKLGLSYIKVLSPGTSEDLAFLVAHQLRAVKIFALGTHTSIIDFYEKGRKGMASTLLTRLKVADYLIDIKGINKLTQQGVKGGSLLLIFVASFFPLLILAFNIHHFQAIFQLIIMRLFLGY